MAMTDSPTNRPRRPLLTREAVVEAAARVLQRDGIAGLTMRRVADDLGVQAPALYWYVASKEELQVLLYDHLMAGFEVTVAGADWRDNIREAAQQLRRHMRGKRDISLLAPHDFRLGPNSVAQLDAGLAMLRQAGLSDRDAAYGFNMLYGFVLNWVAGESEWNQRVDAAGGEFPGTTETGIRAQFEPAEYPNVADLALYLAADDLEGRFEFGLGCMIAGLERLIASRDPRPDRR
jgi:TetR/AcrR family tetracycline transcriptional repressor